MARKRIPKVGIMSAREDLMNKTRYGFVLDHLFVKLHLFRILSPSAIEASHPGLMRQFELYAIITQPIALMSIAACLASGRLCLFT